MTGPAKWITTKSVSLVKLWLSFDLRQAVAGPHTL
jgi:hypothetical protein